jgi:transcriptional regulator with XRE-family HTH domain
MTEEKPISTKKSYVPEDVRLEEAKRLRKLWDDATHNTRHPLTQLQFAQKYNVGTQGFVQQLLNGKRPLNLETALPFVSYLRCDIGEFSPRLKAMLVKLTSSVNGPEYHDLIARLTPEIADMISKYTNLAPHDQKEIAKTVNDRYQSMVSVLDRMAPHKVNILTKMTQPNELIDQAS